MKNRNRRSHGRKSGKVAKATKKYVKKVLDAELEDKYYTTDLDQTTFLQAPGVAPVMNPLSLMDTVPEEQGRIGNQIKAKFLEMEIRISNSNLIPVINGPTGPTTRMIVFEDKQCNGSLPVGTPTAANPNDAVLETQYPTEILNPNTRSRFRILMDKIFVCKPQYLIAANSQQTEVQIVRFRKKLSHKINYIGDSSVASALGKGNLFWFALTDQLTGAADVKINVHTVLRYQDA